MIDKKKLQPTDYVFKRTSNTTDKWEDTDIAYKQAKLFITVKWAHNNLVKLKENKTAEDLKIAATKAPPILVLEDNEKFVDVDGVLLDIEVRGTRNIENIYFNVKDIGEKFKLGDVTTTLLNKTSAFIEFTHYTNFIISNKKNSREIKRNGKHLFLTYRGMQRIFEVSKGITDNARKLLQQWLGGLVPVVKPKKCIVRLRVNNIHCGYAYCVTAKRINHVKIGYWTKTIGALRSRYVTYYGNDCQLFYVQTQNPPLLEKICHEKFAKYRIENELFIKEHLEEYKNYLIKNCMPVKKECLEYLENCDELNIKKCPNCEKNLMQISTVDYPENTEYNDEQTEDDIITYDGELVTKIKELEMEIERKTMEIALERKNNENELERKDHELERKTHENELERKNYELERKTHENELISKNYELAMIKLELANQKMAAELLKPKNNQEIIPKVPQLKQKNKPEPVPVPVPEPEPEPVPKPVSVSKTKNIKKIVKKNI